jgi:hypothetical protein
LDREHRASQRHVDDSRFDSGEINVDKNFRGRFHKIDRGSPLPIIGPKPDDVERAVALLERRVDPFLKFPFEPVDRLRYWT